MSANPAKEIADVAKAVREKADALGLDLDGTAVEVIVEENGALWLELGVNPIAFKEAFTVRIGPRKELGPLLEAGIDIVEDMARRYPSDDKRVQRGKAEHEFVTGLLKDMRPPQQDVPQGKVVGITGLKGSGKDTFGSVLVAEGGYKRVSFASPFKRKCATFLGLTMDEMEARKEEVRPLLQWYGTEWGRTEYPDRWVNLARESIMRELQAGHSVVVTDVRFPNEAEMIRDDFGGVLLRMKRLGRTPPEDLHESEKYALTMDVDGESACSTAAGCRGDALRFLREGVVCFKPQEG